MMAETPLDPLVDGTKKATIHFAKAAYEVAAGVGALFGGITRIVRPSGDDDDAAKPEHITVE